MTSDEPSAAPRLPGLFITGVDTEVGKTYVTASIARQLVRQGVRVGVYKPIASGCRLEREQLISDDAKQLWEAAGRPLTLQDVCPQCFQSPVAPNRAAAVVGKQVDSQLLRNGLDVWQQGFDMVLVEGAGGLMSPLSDQDYTADLAIDLGLPLVVVVANRLGAINATLQTLITAQAYRFGLPVAGVVLNTLNSETDTSAASNYVDIARSSPAPVLADVRWQGDVGESVDWFTLAGGVRG